MGRSAYGARPTCESCKSIDVRRWHREGRLTPVSTLLVHGRIPMASRPVALTSARKLMRYCCRTRHAIVGLPNGNRSISECGSAGRTVTSADDARGSSVQCIPTADTVDDGWQFCTDCGTISGEPARAHP
jgi:hypothetical protein